MSRRGARWDSYCPLASGAYHNWMVTHHTADWKRFRCVCSRCGTFSWMSADTYKAWDELQIAYWYLRQRERGPGLLD